MTSFFSLAAFKILSLLLIFDSFIIMCLGESLFEFVWWRVSFRNLDVQLFPQVWEFSPMTSWSFMSFFPPSPPSGTAIIYTLFLWVVFHNHIGFSHSFSFFFSLFSTDWIIWKLKFENCKFTDFGGIHFPVSGFCCFFSFHSHNIQLQNFCLVLFYYFQVFFKKRFYLFTREWEREQVRGGTERGSENL